VFFCCFSRGVRRRKITLKDCLDGVADA